jgi:hypothetical protein
MSAICIIRRLPAEKSARSAAGRTTEITGHLRDQRPVFAIHCRVPSSISPNPPSRSLVWMPDQKPNTSILLSTSPALHNLVPFPRRLAALLHSSSSPASPLPTPPTHPAPAMVAFVNAALPVRSFASSLSPAAATARPATVTAKWTMKKSASVPFVEAIPGLIDLPAGSAEFDPLALSASLPVSWMQEAEIKHGRVRIPSHRHPAADFTRP